MATKEEHPERYGWWLNELESHGISAKRTNELNDLKELFPKAHRRCPYQSANN